MLVQYTPFSSLTESEKQQLRAILPNMVLEGRAYVDIGGGKLISCHELRAIKESMTRPQRRQQLFE